MTHPFVIRLFVIRHPRACPPSSPSSPILTTSSSSPPATMLLLQQRGWDLHYINLCTGNGGSVQMDGPTTTQKRLEEGKRPPHRSDFLSADLR